MPKLEMGHPRLWYASERAIFPDDLADQVMRLGHVYTVRLPIAIRDEFRNHLFLYVFERLSGYLPPDHPSGRGSKLSNWIRWQAKGAFTAFIRPLQRSHDREIHTLYGDDREDEHGRIVNESMILSSRPDLYCTDPYVDTNLILQLATERFHVRFSEEEKLVIEMKQEGADPFLNDHLTGQIATALGSNEAHAKAVISLARAKLKALCAMAQAEEQPYDPVESMVRVHRERDEPFPRIPFQIGVPAFDSCCRLRGIGGVQDGIFIARGTAAVRQNCVMEVRIPVRYGPTMDAIYQKCRRIVNRCSRLQLNVLPDQVVLRGTLPRDEAGADIIWAILLVESCRRSRQVRNRVPFHPNNSGYDQLIRNLQDLDVVRGPACEAAIEAWRGRLHGKTSPVL
jgi:hypothetical protein